MKLMIKETKPQNDLAKEFKNVKDDLVFAVSKIDDSEFCPFCRQNVFM